MPFDSPAEPEAQDVSTDIPASATASHSSQLTVVGIGASAGGLPALRGFFAAMPVDSGITFVVIVHLSPQHESVLAELVQTSTALPVMQVTGRVEMMPNCVYVIPPGKRLLVSGGALELADLEILPGPRMQIDLFFRSLAEARGDGAAIILSGTGSDGAVGIQAIKEHGGLILVQSPEEAEYDSMPRSAIATGLADAVAPVAELAQRLVAAKQIRVVYKLPEDPEGLSEESLNTVKQILAELRSRTGHDFSEYKRPTMLRRIGRRMQLTRQSSLTGYLHQLRQDSDESHYLMRDLLINVTQFFREPEAWEFMSQSVIPKIFAGKGSRDTVRVWAAGCATGEEAYTLAILLLESAKLLHFAGKIQVFATDLSAEAIEYARAGIYPAAIAADISEERLASFFIPEESHYRVGNAVREVVLFAHHNLLIDPPFSRIDLIACRNLLIYLQREVQMKICDTFHYAMRSNGYLFLGNAESLDNITDLFKISNKNSRIYQRNNDERSVLALPPVTARRPGKTPQPRPKEVRRARPVAADEHQLRLEEMGPPSLLVDTNYHVLHLSDTVGRYLAVRGGSPTDEVLQLVRPELQSALRSALKRALEQGRAVFSAPVLVELSDASHPVTIWVRPVPGGAEQLLILFWEDGEISSEGPTSDADMQHAAALQLLEAELLESQRSYQAIDENYETALEELRAANEELQLINEEHRSTLEALETGKEELQSLNEELHLVNQELQGKMDEVNKVHGDLVNFVLATNIAALFLDHRLRIMRFTPGAAELFNLLPSDQNRLISHLRPKVQYAQLENDVRKVLANLTPIMREVQDVEGRWFLVHVRPYRTLKDTVEGVVITFTDVTESKEMEVERLVTEARFAQVWETTSDAMALSDAEGMTVAANPAYLRLYGYSAEEVVGQSFAIIFPAETQEAAVEQYKQIFASEENPTAFESTVQRADGSQRIVEARMSFLDTDGERTAMLSVIRDITERKQAEAELHQLNETLESRVQERIEQVRVLITQLTMSEQEERRRISAILHDDLQQRLYSLNFQLDTLRSELIGHGMEEMQPLLDEIDEALADSVKTTRSLSVDLSPPILYNEGLYAALRWLAAQMEQQQRLAVSVVSQENLPPIDDDLRVLLFQFVRELLFNVVKHAGVAVAVVTLAFEDNYLCIEVSDQGRGFSSDIVTYGNSQGLLRVTQRLELIQGRMNVESRPGEGTCVTLYVPLQKKEE